MPELVILTGPIAAGKNTVADELARLLTARGRIVVVADVDDVAAMMGSVAAAARSGLWFAAHQVHGALVGGWMRSAVDYVVVVGPIYSDEEQAALTDHLPPETVPRWIVIDAPVAVTFARAQADPDRGLSKEAEFHHEAHARFRELLPAIPADRTFNSADLTAAQIAAEIFDAL